MRGGEGCSGSAALQSIRPGDNLPPQRFTRRPHPPSSRGKRMRPIVPRTDLGEAELASNRAVREVRDVWTLT